MYKHLPKITLVMIVAMSLILGACGTRHPADRMQTRARHDVGRIANNMAPRTDRNIVSPIAPRTDRNIVSHIAPRTDGTVVERGYGTSVTDTTNTASHLKKAEQIAKSAEKVSGIRKATVVLHGKDAIVGLDVKNTTDAARIEKHVQHALKKEYPQHNIHVTTDKALHARIVTTHSHMTSTHPVKNLAEDVRLIIRDIGSAITAPLR
ncbi:YhcN/YlaJ family sporulation lipoprotein [Paenibacillus sp. sgz302251]|uniref:YhcN/YlaJ family sporulation lipoprotein n=1 Tax=Paenibacillus sp. sgz302251 TaxID=3414493 RepID=UPI003C7BD8EC